MLSAPLAQQIARDTSEVIGYNVLITDDRGIVIGSGDAARLGSFHEASVEVLASQQAAWHTAAEAARLRGVKPGMTLPIVIDGEAVGTVGITGSPRQVRRFGLVVRRQTEILLQESVELRSRLLRERALEELVRDIGSFDEDVVDPAFLAARSEELGFDLTVPRTVIIVEVDEPTPTVTDVVAVRPELLRTLRQAFGPSDLVAATTAGRFAVLPVLSPNARRAAAAQPRAGTRRSTPLRGGGEGARQVVAGERLRRAGRQSWRPHDGQPGGESREPLPGGERVDRSGGGDSRGQFAAGEGVDRSGGGDSRGQFAAGERVDRRGGGDSRGQFDRVSDGESRRELGERAARAIGLEHGFVARAGVGGVARGVVELREAYADAGDAVRLGKACLPGRAAYVIDELRGYQLLAAVGQRARGRLVGAAGELATHADWLELRGTLIAWCESGFNLVRTAEVLHIHRNTLIYRLEKVERLTGRSWRDHRATLTLYLACLASQLD